MLLKKEHSRRVEGARAQDQAVRRTGQRASRRTTMKPFGTRLAFLVLALGVAPAGTMLIAPPAPLSAQEKPKTSAVLDTVVFTDGTKTTTRKDGKIESIDYGQIEYAAGGKKLTIPAGDVLEIRFGDDPSGDFEKGTRALLARDADAARSSFEKAVLARTALPDLRAWVDDFANCGAGEASLLAPPTDAKAADRAAEAFTKAKSANPKSFVLDRILKGLAQAEARRKKPADAAKALDELIVAAKAAKRSTWEIDAHFSKAQIQLEAGNTAGAISAFDDAIRFAETSIGAERNEAVKAKLKTVAVDAAVGKGWAMVGEGRGREGAGRVRRREDRTSTASRRSTRPSRRSSAPSRTPRGGRSSRPATRARRSGSSRARRSCHVQAHNEVARSLWYQAECWKALGDEKARAERISELKSHYPRPSGHGRPTRTRFVRHGSWFAGRSPAWLGRSSQT